MTHDNHPQTRAPSRARAWTWPVGGARPLPGVAQPQSGFLIGAHIRKWAAEEIAAGRLLPWLAVSFGFGVVLYFTADREPAWWAPTALAAACAAGAMLLRRHTAAFVVALGLFAIAAGFAVATIHTARIAHPVLRFPASSVTIAGTVELREESQRTDRFVLRVDRIAGARLDVKPARVRLSVKRGMAPAAGSFVEVKATLDPPLQPLEPGSYDFARDLYFQDIGASGFVRGAVTVLAPPAAPGMLRRADIFVQNLRDGIDARIRAVLPGDEGAIAAMLINGRRDAIDPHLYDTMFVSGIGHVLSISGYHMAVVAGMVFFLLRALLALIPGLPDRAPIKKWAAFAALLVTAFYLVLSGNQVATQRSFIMIAVVLIGVLVDRPGFATMPYAAFHFHRLSPYGVIANLLAMPVVSAWVMPMGILGVVAMPFGFDAECWRLMGYGIEWMDWVALWVASLPGAYGRVTLFGTGPLLLATAGLLLMTLLKTPLRWSGALFMLVAVIAAARTPRPDVLIAADGRAVAVRGIDGTLSFHRTGSDTFAIREWLAADADGRDVRDPKLGVGIGCDPAGCIGKLADGALVSYALSPAALEEDCGRAKLIVALYDPPPDCAALVIGRNDWRRRGALTLRRTERGFVMDSARAAYFDRPWAPAPPPPRPSLGKAPAPADATPRLEDIEVDQ